MRGGLCHVRHAVPAVGQVGPAYPACSKTRACSSCHCWRQAELPMKASRLPGLQDGERRGDIGRKPALRPPSRWTCRNLLSCDS